MTFLVLPAIRRRYSQSNVLKITVINNEVSAHHQPEHFNQTSGRCIQCVERENLNNKLKTKCSKCQNFIYKKHQTELEFICEDCTE